MIDLWKAFWRQFGFYTGRRSIHDLEAWTGTDDFETAPFFTAHKAKTERLAAIARERDALKLSLVKAKRQKKAVAPILRKLRDLTNEEMRLDLGR